MVLTITGFFIILDDAQAAAAHTLRSQLQLHCLLAAAIGRGESKREPFLGAKRASYCGGKRRLVERLFITQVLFSTRRYQLTTLQGQRLPETQ